MLVYVTLIWIHTVLNTYNIVLGGEEIYYDIKKNIISR